jgi:hypothetical protein
MAVASRSITDKIGPHVRREVGLVDDEQVAARHAGASLARDLVAAGDVDT